MRALAVAGDVKTTTCTAVGGSRENGSPLVVRALSGSDGVVHAQGATTAVTALTG